jgi:hypothetical protein
VVDRQVPVDIVDEEIVVEPELDAVVEGALVVVGEEEDCVLDEILLDVDGKVVELLGIKKELLEEADVVDAAGSEALDATELPTVEEVVWVSEVEVAAAKVVLSDTEVVDIMTAVAPNSYICKFSIRNSKIMAVHKGTHIKVIACSTFFGAISRAREATL